ncbi:MAG: hypothetical protein O7F08_13280 [Deltaproteobacteria bacterium]|nr:hypothetical protein [Deltaproteobacteria bacterium]
MIDKRFASAAAWVLILWGIGHNVVIDILPLVFGVYLYEVDPATLEQMRDTVVRFPFMGETNMYFAFYGLSIWLGVSLISVGVLNLLFARSEPGRAFRRAVYAVDIALAMAFLAIAVICFFVIPVIGATLALLLYLAAFVTSARAPTARST